MNKLIESKLFRELELEWYRYIEAMAHRFSMEPGDEDDLYNEGLIILYETSCDKQFNLDDDNSYEDFSKVFRTKLGWHFTNYVSSCKAQCRDVKLKAKLEYSTDGDGITQESESIELHSGVVDQIVNNYYHEYPENDIVDKFRNKFKLDDDDKLLLDELMEPSLELTKLWNYFIKKYEYDRIPSEIPWYVYAAYLTQKTKKVWTIKRIQYIVNWLREAYVQFTGRKDLVKYINY